MAVLERECVVDLDTQLGDASWDGPAGVAEDWADGSWWPAAKRVFDIAASAVFLLAMLPIILCIAVAIKLDSRGPVLYRARRVGYRGRPLMMLKFRKMYDGATGRPLTEPNDPRLTRVGALLTRTRLDELPQLWDVLRGRMSIIGPRPEDPAFVDLHRRQYDQILSVRPGMTGLSQLAFLSEGDMLDAEAPVADYVRRIMPHKLLLDTLYTQRSALRLDMSVMFWTLVAVLLRRPVAVDRSTANMRVRRRPETTQQLATATQRPGQLA